MALKRQMNETSWYSSVRSMSANSNTYMYTEIPYIGSTVSTSTSQKEGIWKTCQKEASAGHRL